VGDAESAVVDGWDFRNCDLLDVACEIGLLGDFGDELLNLFFFSHDAEFHGAIA